MSGTVSGAARAVKATWPIANEKFKWCRCLAHSGTSRQKRGSKWGPGASRKIAGALSGCASPGIGTDARGPALSLPNRRDRASCRIGARALSVRRLGGGALLGTPIKSLPSTVVLFTQKPCMTCTYRAPQTSAVDKSASNGQSTALSRHSAGKLRPQSDTAPTYR